MARFNSPLDRVRVAAPCTADWNQMLGDERVRFCQQCSLNVYNLSSMTRREAESLISNTEGRLCVRYYRRRDGTIITNNCPVGLRAIKRRISRTASATLSAVLSFFAGLGLYNGLKSDEPRPFSNTMGVMAVPTVDSVKVGIDPPTAIKGELDTVGEKTVRISDAYKVNRRVRKAARR